MRMPISPEWKKRNLSLFADIIAAIRDDHKLYEDAVAGRNEVEMIMAIYKSQKIGQPVKLPLEEFKSIDMAGMF